MHVLFFEDFIGVECYLPQENTSEISWHSLSDSDLEKDPRFQVCRKEFLGLAVIRRDSDFSAVD